ncbi:DUF2933 domain-containing protein [Microvirga arsenatis]|uniref:DUF2933 domain-containing protein n=1 Tax=Microvirga arsenatis TaxID=2692265 RepID=A0ABW9Z4K2_9HYPH|nr:DUF2933 domain-containing protein [Microvirga arsenatis]NBJ13125.1 DUF2933 domain-containing protein [Microvirga arsenatis]NBJ26876.1 DUF2933 domain-containing protein [Microvirga arsenatis]
MDVHAPGRQRAEASRLTGLIPSPFAWILTLGAGLLGLYLIATHTGHVLEALPYLLLACPMMHLVMHRGQGWHGGHRH